ncbi:hypothetical protein IOQ59_00500 [Pontibacterium sp. N1Y112]|uniref:Uncharacterized protein n=1 Tax=Pontibacterium sinense TaxID=2781979 RepID=A0A8J7F9Y7_9GAMM|nr:hypothetical protein [Pontibacterium sinense]MBE9395736.1 hypothetical protein [Pontibacterium sinense]
MSTQEFLQQWATDNGVKGIRFYPTNPTADSAEGILAAAHEAIVNLDNGRAVAFVDPIQASE